MMTFANSTWSQKSCAIVRLIFRAALANSVHKGAAGHQLVHERRAVDDGDERVELGDRRSEGLVP